MWGVRISLRGRDTCKGGCMCIIVGVGCVGGWGKDVTVCLERRCSMTRLMLTSATTGTIAITQERKGRKG